MTVFGKNADKQMVISLLLLVLLIWAITKMTAFVAEKF